LIKAIEMPACAGSQGPGEIHRSGLERQGFFNGNCVVSDNMHLLPQLAEVLDKVEGETVVVVDHQQHMKPIYLILFAARLGRCQFYLPPTLPTAIFPQISRFERNLSLF
jgi:hypothetical protein